MKDGLPAVCATFVAESSFGVAFCEAIHEQGVVVDFVTRYANAAFEQQTGISGVVGQRFLETHRDVADRPETAAFFDVIRRVLAVGRAETLELYSPAIHQWMFLEVARLQPGFFSCLFRSINERRQREERVRRRLSDQSFLLEGPSVGYWKVVDRTFAWTNRAFEKMLGYDVGELVGKSSSCMHVSPESFAEVDTRIAEIMRNGCFDVAPQFEIELVRKDGSHGWFEVAVLPKWEKDHLALFGSCIDRSEYRKAQLALAESEERLALALYGSDAAFFDWDIASSTVILDKEWMRLIGIAPEALVTRREGWLQTAHPEDRALIDDTFEGLLSGALSAGAMEFRLQHSKGHWVWLRFRGRVVHRESRVGACEPLRMVGSVVDVSDRKQNERESEQLLRRLAQLFRASNAAGPSASASGEGGSVLALLSRRQRQVFKLIASGLTSAEVAEKLNLSEATVLTHRRELMHKLNLKNVVALTRLAIDEGEI
ncbi:PAS domain-containing protein [Propionivibrio dicarboxylicus]|uniref:PAS domain-containing protein n=1 Tax=Propionivibrio dicarboxylicus TaxID=83767 RepID=UPI0015A17E9A|nr:PAS domain-containing protein [Propionivibrio dicarboxylicus]